MSEVSSERKWGRVLVTGASSGLGEEYARQLAPVCDELVLVARRVDRLQELGKELKSQYPYLQVSDYGADLVNREDRSRFIEWLKAEGKEPDLLINNAGMGDYGDLASAEWEKIEAMMELNMTALTHLLHALLPSLKASEKAGVINVSSLASIMPIPDFAVYAATKAYVTSFSEAMRMELLEDKVPVLAVCPGPVHTEFGKTAIREGGHNEFAGRERIYVEAETVVSESLESLDKNKPRFFPGALVKGISYAVGLLPMSLFRVYLSKRPRRAQ